MNDLKGIIEDCNKSDLVSKKVIEKVIKIIGQKKWNRIYDEESDICTTMGELIITLKGIPDLEKEKCELLGIIQGKDKVIKELGKENKELKENLAGLKAGRPKWHKVADGDLPKNENDVLVYSGEEWRMCVGRYSPKNKAWEAGCDTVAWCEIPEYKGE